MKIKVVSNYDSDDDMYKTVSNCFENNTDLILVNDESYDKLVVINGYHGRINVSRDSIIGILQEPIGNSNYDRNLHFYYLPYHLQTTQAGQITIIKRDTPSSADF